MTAHPDTAAPAGRKKLAQGKERSDAALGHESQNTSSPEGAKEMRGLPMGWEWVTFGNVCKVQGGFAFKSADYQQGGVPLVRISNLVKGRVSFDSDTVFLSEAKLAEHPDFLIRSGDSLIAMSGATTGKMATYDLETPALLNQRVGRFRISLEARCLPRFVALLVDNLTKRVLKEAYGAAQPNISPTQIEEIEIPLPTLDEQRRIVAEIEKQFTRLEAGVAALRRVRANLKRYRAAVLKAACEGRLVPTEAELFRAQISTKNPQPTYETGEALLARILTERRQNWQGRGKYKGPAALNSANLGSLPEGWTWASGEQLFSWSSGEGLTQKDIQEGKYPVYGGNGVTGYHNAFVAEIPTLVIGRVGALCGNVYLTDGPAWITDNAIYAIQTPACVAMRFIRLSFARAELNKHAAGSGQPFVNQRMLNETIISLPPLAEQTRIVAEVERRSSVVEELEAVVSANLQRATRLRQSILQKAFTGELTS